jgi:prepilin-type N-terminal cleavage/methylation domain-containing protein
MGVMMKDQRGISLIEMLAVMALASIMLTLGAGAMRNYWFVRSLQGGAEEAQNLMRRLQSQVTSESHPRVYGLRFTSGSGIVGLVRYESGNCAQPRTTTLGGSGFGSAGAQATFPNTSYSLTQTGPSNFGFWAGGADPSVVPETAACRTQLSGASTDQFVWFYARGTATPGRMQITVPALPGRSRTIEVRQLTGRVIIE